MNQFGQTQPIGGVNEKIEGFFDVCASKGKVAEQGVIIPKANTHNLMLRQDVIDAVAEGRFFIWAIEHVNEAIALLTGLHVDSKNDAGEYGKDAVFGLIEARLRALRS